MKKTLLIVLTLISGIIASAQNDKADKLFANWDYYGAAQLYEKEVVTKPTQDNYYKLGECYHKMSNYSQELKAFDKVNSMGAYTKSVFYLNYGMALKTSERYDDAKVAFQKYIDMEPSDPRGVMYLNSCDVVVEDHKGDLPIDIQNLGSVNTADADFCPVIYKGGIVFTSDRLNAGHSKTDEWTGSHFLEVYSANKSGNDSTFGAAVALSDVINNRYHDGPACFSKNYDTIYFSRVDKTLKGKAKKDPGIERSKIYISVMNKGKWSSATPFFLNSDNYSVAHPALSNSGNRLYFASDMPGGMGGSDIWYCDKNGSEWGQAVNAGPNVNTVGTDNYPSPDSTGNLYFSSDGYKGFGGLDICVAKLTNGSFEKAVPMKCPINSASDDFGITFLQNGKKGYFSSNRPGGKGSDDIYYFDLSNTKDKNLASNVYVMGYKYVPPPPPVVVKVDSVKIAPPPPPPPPPDLHINFDVDKYTLRTDATAKLNEIVAYLQNHSNQMVQVNGFTDASGQEDYNKTLSDERANAAAQYILSKGIDKSRVRTVGFGPHQLVLTEQVYDRVKEEVNRRVQFQWMPVGSPASTPAVSFTPAGYAIEITTSTTEMPNDSPEFNGLTGIYHIRYENGIFCYYYGFYATSAAAVLGLKDLSAKGLSAGMVVGMSNKIH